MLTMPLSTLSFYLLKGRLKEETEGRRETDRQTNRQTESARKVREEEEEEDKTRLDKKSRRERERQRDRDREERQRRETEREEKRLVPSCCRLRCVLALRLQQRQGGPDLQSRSSTADK